MKIRIRMGKTVGPAQAGTATSVAETEGVTRIGVDIEEILARVGDEIGGQFYDAIYDVATFAVADHAGNYAPVTSVAGKTGAVTLVAADLSDFDSAAQNSAAAYVASYTNEAAYDVCSGNVATSVTFIVKA